MRIEERFGSTISLKAVWLLLVDTLGLFVRYSMRHEYDARVGMPGARRGPAGRPVPPIRARAEAGGRLAETGADSAEQSRDERSYTRRSRAGPEWGPTGRRTRTEDQVPHDPTAIRNVALVGHHGAGKTTLAEALLAATGSVARRGSVEKGSTVMDFEPEEVSRQLSISTCLAPFTVNGVKVNLLDTPGYADFAGEMVTALANVDLAVVVVSATDGVQAQTEDAWRAAARLGVPRVIVINKLDRERADFDRDSRRDPPDLRGGRGAGRAAHRARGRLPRRDRPARRHGDALRRAGRRVRPWTARCRPPGTRARSPTTWSTRSTRSTSSSSRASWWATTT